MEYIRRKFEKEDLGGSNKVRIHPICCWHLGARQCDMEFIHQTVKEIKDDPASRWVYMGDGGECVTRLSKGNVFEQTLSPQQQADILHDLLEPIKEKGLLGIRGNHGNRIDLETGLSFDKSFLTSLSVPYLGVSALANIVVARSSYDLYFHHGAPSGASLQSKVNAAKKFSHIIADVRVTGHSHVAMELDPDFYTYADNQARRSRLKPIHQCIAGCAYDSSVEGYAEEKAYSPILPGRIRIDLDGSIAEGKRAHKVSMRVERSMGDRDVVGYTEKALTDWLTGQREREW